MKAAKKKRLTIFISPSEELYKKIQEQAAKEHRSVAAMANIVLGTAFGTVKA